MFYVVFVYNHSNFSNKSPHHFHSITCKNKTSKNIKQQNQQILKKPSSKYSVEVELWVAYLCTFLLTSLIFFSKILGITGTYPEL